MRPNGATDFAVCAATAFLAFSGCGKHAAEPVLPHSVPVAHVTAAELPVPATPAALPAIASATAQAASESPVASVDIHGGPEGNPGPVAVGDAASFHVTLRNADGAFLRPLDPLLGGKMLLVATRADLSWSTVVRADELSDKVHGGHEFRVVFPLAGIYRAWVLYAYAGQVLTQELSFSVTGPPSAGQELPDIQSEWQGENGLAGRLKVLPKLPTTCQPFLLATAWTRDNVPLRMTAEPEAQTTWYVLVEGGLAEIVTSSLQPQPVSVPGDATSTAVMKMGGDLGTAVTLQVAHPGRYRVFAVATPPGAKAGHPAPSIIAAFVINVQGATAADGCKK